VQPNDATGPSHATNKTPCSQRQKYSLLATGVVLFLAALWFWTSGMLYTPATAYFPFRTSGWFVLVLPLTLTLAFGYAGVFWLFSRWTGVLAQWCLLLVCSAALITVSIPPALPSSRLRRVLGEEAAQQANMEYLSVHDSLEDARLYVGKVSGPETLLQSVIAYHSLDKHEAVDINRLKWTFEDDALPEKATAYRNDFPLVPEWGYFYFNPENKRLYFVWHRG
jgi:hypothetical protein